MVLYKIIRGVWSRRGNGVKLRLRDQGVLQVMTKDMVAPWKKETDNQTVILKDLSRYTLSIEIHVGL